MQRPSITTILGVLFMVYVSYSAYSITRLFTSLECTAKPCYTSILSTNPRLQLNLFTSTVNNPLSKDVTKIGQISNFDYRNEFSRDFTISIPTKARANGTMFLHIVLVNDFGKNYEWTHLKREGLTVLQRIKLTEYMVPRPATFNLLHEKESVKIESEKSNIKPVAHWKPQVYVSVLTDNFTVSHADIPPEMGHLIRSTKKNEILPIIQNDFLRTRLADLIEINQNSTSLPLTFHYKPITVGKLRLILHVEHALQAMKGFGFTKKDVDEVKGIFSESNLYLLCGTMLIASVHILFDFLSFKNDIAFWNKRKSYVGLSMRTTLWRTFSQIVIFLYLLDQHTSMLVLVPAFISTVIELWKSKKILKLEFSWSGVRVKSDSENKTIEKAEALTKAIDREGMRYLSYLLYPLCLAGAVYSLIYQPHKSWYSWTVNSMVNGVYAFGFLFMLPQLFVNYKLKSVAALPWRAFMYKAFNTFIDDIFAFIITMPTAHRIACFRDDIVFLIYLIIEAKSLTLIFNILNVLWQYQRWLYPVDQNRLDNGVGEVDATPESTTNDEAASKKTN